MTGRYKADAVMAGLKDFQRRTVDFAFARMFGTEKPSRRFLVADEVGLGKTLIAKGLIARTIEHLQAKDGRVDIIYVCSNQDIAAQNISRLAQPGLPAFAHATRLTLLPLVVQQLRQHTVNFISFTPGTTFNQSNRTGIKVERRLIYQMLKGLLGIDQRGLRNSLKGSGDVGRWIEHADQVLEFDIGIAEGFRTNLAADRNLLSEVREIAESARDLRRSISDIEVERRLEMIGLLRRCLARTCLSALEPDLVILDEFQRFSDLFDSPDKNPSAELAHELFNYSDDLRILLLSATPYKMFASEDDPDDHYGDFIKTMRFLMLEDAEQVDSLKKDIASFRTKLLGMRAATDFPALTGIKSRIENALKTVMCRTERVGTTARADAMVKEEVIVPELTARDLHDFRVLETVALRLGQPDTVEYWKSSPYLMNFMRDYGYKHALRNDQKKTVSDLGDALLNSGKGFSSHRIDRYRPIEPGNARLRTLIAELRAKGLYRLVWMPASMPYWQPNGAYQDIGSVSKQLVFSAWNVVPDAVAALLSYDAEREMVLGAGEKVAYGGVSKKFSQRLTFRQKDDRLSGMLNLMLMFPSVALSELVDPLRLSGTSGEALALDEVRQAVANTLRPSVEPLLNRSVTTGNEDHRWYWVSMALLETSRNPASREWCSKHWSEARSGSEDDEQEPQSLFGLHVRQWTDAWSGGISDLGRVPADLIDVLVNVALAGPGTCALRTIRRLWALNDATTNPLMSAAARIAWGLRSQFNSPRVIALLQEVEDDGSYWRRVLHYGVDGNLQAVLDEYGHVLAESRGSSVDEGVHPAQGMANAMFEAMTLRAATLRPDEVSIRDGRLRIEPFATGIRTHFALRFGGKNVEEGATNRKEAVQSAFNSPFWPFVLTSTSVGQEGLDFHVWCHAVVHWNLPSNPVDMEQREGRVHRYKGYAIRKNIASRFAAVVRSRSDESVGDPWTKMFCLAAQERPAMASDLIPYWLYEVEGGDVIERRIMALPLSRDEARYRRLRRNLALYRMVFAQPRQEDLLACLADTVSEGEARELIAEWRINLEPERQAGDVQPIRARPSPERSAALLSEGLTTIVTQPRLAP